MEAAQAVEMAYLIQERERTQRLLDALNAAVDCTMQTEGLRFTISEGGLITHPELPHMLMRTMFETGHLLQGVQSYLSRLDERLDEFGITIELGEKPRHRNSTAL